MTRSIVSVLNPKIQQNQTLIFILIQCRLNRLEDNRQPKHVNHIQQYQTKIEQLQAKMSRLNNNDASNDDLSDSPDFDTNINTNAQSNQVLANTERNMRKMINNKLSHSGTCYIVNCLLGAVSNNPYVDKLLQAQGIDISDTKITNQKQIPLENVGICNAILEQHYINEDCYINTDPNAPNVISREFSKWANKLGARYALQSLVKIITSLPQSHHLQGILQQSEKFECSISHTTVSDYVPRIDKNICIFYTLYGTCKKEEKCKLSHVCIICLGDHPLFKCPLVPDACRSKQSRCIHLYRKAGKGNNRNFNRNWNNRNNRNNYRSNFNSNNSRNNSNQNNRNSQ